MENGRERVRAEWLREKKENDELNGGRREKDDTSPTVASLLFTLAVGLTCTAAASDLVMTLVIRPQPSFYYLARAGNEPVELKQVEINERKLSGC